VDRLSHLAVGTDQPLWIYLLSMAGSRPDTFFLQSGNKKVSSLTGVK
jgi:hypothetical protein